MREAPHIHSPSDALGGHAISDFIQAQITQILLLQTQDSSLGLPGKKKKKTCLWPLQSWFSQTTDNRLMKTLKGKRGNQANVLSFWASMRAQSPLPSEYSSKVANVQLFSVFHQWCVPETNSSIYLWSNAASAPRFSPGFNTDLAVSPLTQFLNSIWYRMSASVPCSTGQFVSLSKESATEPRWEKKKEKKVLLGQCVQTIWQDQKAVKSIWQTNEKCSAATSLTLAMSLHPPQI